MSDENQEIPNTTPFWLQADEPESPPTYPTVTANHRVDVVVIGGGITGVTAAYLLKQAGKTVALVERRRCGRGETGHTTAHVTAVPDRPLRQLVDELGSDHAQAVWDAGFAAIARIRANVRDERINCDFAWVQGWMHGSPDADIEASRIELGREAEIAEALGIDALYVDSVPGVGTPGVLFESQARFHPTAYLDVLASRIPGDGSYVFEDSEVIDVDDNLMAVRVDGHTLSTDFVVVATHVPLPGAIGRMREAVLQTNLFPYSTYAVSGVMPIGDLPEGLYWEDREGPYEYLRMDRHHDHDRVIFGGSDHKTGQLEDTTSAFAEVERRLHARVTGVNVTHRWSGQVLETRDGLPYIGEIKPRVFAATGYAGNGMTFGTLAGMMAVDAVFERQNPWSRLFDINRTQALTGVWNYLKENVDYPYYLVRDRFTGAQGKSARSVRRGHGKILHLDGHDVAVYRDDDGVVTKLSPVCTHLGCKVRWNTAEQSWDCPCHGSRFAATGEVMAGPADRPLPKA